MASEFHFKDQDTGVEMTGGTAGKVHIFGLSCYGHYSEAVATPEEAAALLRGLMRWMISKLDPIHFVRVRLDEALRALEGR